MCFIIFRRMSETSKYGYQDQKQQETSDQFYPTSKVQEKVKSSINALLVSLNSRKTQLRSHEIQQDAFKQKLNELDVEAGRLVIANQYLQAQDEELTTKSDEYLFQKSELLKELKEWREAKEGLKGEVWKGEEENREKRKYIETLREKAEDLKTKIKVKECQKKEVYDYNLDLQLTIQTSDNEISKMREQKDCLAKTATTLDTFAKSFKKNIIAKEKELSRAKFQTSQLENLIITKEFQKANVVKEKEKVDWQGKMYEHHNQEIERTNERLKGDLEKLLVHLESLKKNNRSLSASIKDYSDVGAKTAKKILQLVNR